VPPDVSWEDSTRSEPVDCDLLGSPYCNTIDQYFDPPFHEEFSDPLLVYERNEAAFTPSTKLTYEDTLCSDAAGFWGAAAYQPRMLRIRAKLVQAPTPYWRVRYEIVFRMRLPSGQSTGNAWTRYVLNRGTMYRPSAGSPPQPDPNHAIVLLAQNGTKTTAAAPYYRVFIRFSGISWTALGIAPPS
jgi:hypothetical protein